MKKISILLSFVIVGLLSSAAARAVTLENAYIASYRGRTDVPVPVEVVSPTVVGYNDTTRVELKFVVDETGTPKNISVANSVDRDLANALTEAVRDWKFTPAKSNGLPVAKTVILPFLVNGAK